MVIDFLNGGELFYHLTHEDYFSEDRCRFYAAEVTSALCYLHSHNILYRGTLTWQTLSRNNLQDF